MGGETDRSKPAFGADVAWAGGSDIVIPIRTTISAPIKITARYSKRFTAFPGAGR
jgi:hypothetical protein